VFITVLIDLMGIGLVMPVMPKLVESFVGGGPSNASMTFGLLVTSYALASLLGARCWARFSDAIGRRPVLLAGSGWAGRELCRRCVGAEPCGAVLARVFAGLCGASYTTAAAYIADVTQPDRRAAAFGLIGAAAGCGFILGPAIGGLLGDLGPRIPFVVAAILAAGDFPLRPVRAARESAARDPPPFTWRAANPFRALLRLARFKSAAGVGAALFLRRDRRRVSAIDLGVVHRLSLWLERYQVGISLALVGLFFGAAQAGLTRIVVPRLGERFAVILGLSGYILGCVAVRTRDRKLAALCDCPGLRAWRAGCAVGAGGDFGARAGRRAGRAARRAG